MSADITNLKVVDRALNILRGGQPSDKDGWIWLKGMGITNVVKLNTENEGSDEQAEALGLRVHRFPIPWWRQTILRPRQQDLVAAVELLTRGVFIHCQHGEDRTGLVVGCYRLSMGWAKAEAYREMVCCGFHDSLQGLQGRWDSQRPEDWA